MLIAARRLVDRLRHPRSRADELAGLGRRFAAAPSPEIAGAEAVALALEMRALRVELSAALAGATGCTRCSRGHPLPAGRWDGGHCCSGRTEQIFTEVEVAAISLAGTNFLRLAAPRSDHAGCAFRGPTGCSLDPADRANICVRYVCVDLERELRDDGRWSEVRRLRAALAKAFARFTSLQSADHDP
jgi:hypothetical protein